MNSQETNDDHHDENKNENENLDDIWNQSKTTRKQSDNLNEDIWNDEINLSSNNPSNDHHLTSTLSILDGILR